MEKYQWLFVEGTREMLTSWLAYKIRHPSSTLLIVPCLVNAHIFQTPQRSL